MCSYDEENKETTLLNVPAARISPDETDNADTIPLAEGKRDLVSMDVRGGPGFDIENTEIRELVPQISLKISYIFVKRTLISII